MSRLLKAIAVALVALILAAVAFYWTHEHSERPQSAMASSPVPAPSSKPPIEVPAVAKDTEPLSARETRKSSPEPEPGIPLRTGEILEFTADVAKVSNVANLRLQVAERRSFLGKSAWHLQAFARTENPLRMVFELDDQFDSYSDAGTLSSLQYEMHLSERGQKVQSIQRMTTTGKEPAPPNVTEARVLPGTRDPLGMMQYLRSVDWSKTHEVQGPVYDGHKLYDVRASLAVASESVTVPAGQYDAFKIEIRVFDNGTEMKDAHFLLYLAHNDSRTPVLLEAVMPFATARVCLKSVQ